LWLLADVAGLLALFSFFDCANSCYCYDAAEAEEAEGLAVVSAHYVQVFYVDYAVLIDVTVLPSRLLGFPYADAHVVPVEVSFATVQCDCVFCDVGQS